MRSADPRAALAEIASLSSALAAAARSGAWREVLALDETRYRLLTELPTSCFDSADEYARVVLAQAQAVTRFVLDEARFQQTQEADSLRELQRVRRGAHAYLANER